MGSLVVEMHCLESKAKINDGIGNVLASIAKPFTSGAKSLDEKAAARRKEAEELGVPKQLRFGAEGLRSTLSGNAPTRRPNPPSQCLHA